LIPLGSVAEQQVRDLLTYYGTLGRADAQKGLLTAIDEACWRIEQDPSLGLPAPRPYSKLACPGERWIKSSRYWVA
jgi:hypothetical protein